MKEYTATLHAYEIVTPPRCKLERLEPVTADIVLPLHYAESAPVAMRTAGPLEYTGEDGNTYTWRGERIELYALDGMLWKRYDTSRYHPEPWTIDDLANHCATSKYMDNYLERWPWQWRSDPEPPTGVLVRDRGTWATVDKLAADIVSGCDRYAVIAGELYEPASELVYCYDRTDGIGWPRRSETAGRVIVAREYDKADAPFEHYLCNALQDWRVVNIYDEYTDRLQDKLLNEVSGVDVIEVFLPEYVTADPYADHWREEIRRHEERAAKRKEHAKELTEKARAFKSEAKTDKAEAARELEAAAKIAEKLGAYLNAKEA